MKGAMDGGVISSCPPHLPLGYGGVGVCLACTSQHFCVQPGSLVRTNVMLAPNEIFTSKTGFQAPLQISREPRKQAILPMRNEPWCSWWILAGASDSMCATGSTCEQDLLRASCWDVSPLSSELPGARRGASSKPEFSSCGHRMLHSSSRDIHIMVL